MGIFALRIALVLQGEGKQRYYKVRFDDGDVQDFSLLELRHILVDEPTEGEQTGVDEMLQNESSNGAHSLAAASDTQALSAEMVAKKAPVSSSKGGVSAPQPPQQHAADVDLLMGLTT